MSFKAVIIGASGLIGRNLVDKLLMSNNYTEVTSLARKKLPIHSSKLKQIIIDFDHLEDYAEHINGRAIFCCLGSTRKKTPDLTEYHKIDHDYTVKMAEIGAKNGVEQFHLVSSLGADEQSLNFYLKMKGETENDIKGMAYKSIHIYRPSVLIGPRTDSTRFERFTIKLMLLLNPVLFGPLKKYKTIAAKTVASAMYKQSIKHNQQGVFIYQSDQIKKLA
ncbi:MAG: NAD(P)H-binding protein [Mucilaginibacter sp.]